METEAMQTASKADAVSDHNQTNGDVPLEHQGHEPSNEELMAMLDDGEGSEAAPKQEPPKEEAKEDPLSQKFAELAKMESKYQKQIRDMKAKQEALEQQAEGKSSRDELLEELRGQYKKNPKRFLEKELGGSYDELSDYILNEEDRSKEIEANEKLSATEKRIAELEKRIEDKDQSEKETQYKQKIDTFKNNIRDYAKQKGEDFGLVSQLDEIDTVYEVMQNYFEEHGKTMEPDEALEQVESFYMEKIQHLSKLEKVKKLFNVDNRSDQGKPQGDQSRQKEQREESEESETLTSDFISGYSESDLENMSDDERMRIAESFL